MENEIELRREECRKIAQQIIGLKSSLESRESDIGDWKIAKAQEYILVGLESPYDIADLHAKRQAVRDEINRLSVQLDAMQASLVEGDAR